MLQSNGEDANSNGLSTPTSSPIVARVQLYEVHNAGYEMISNASIMEASIVKSWEAEGKSRLVFSNKVIIDVFSVERGAYESIGALKENEFYVTTEGLYSLFLLRALEHTCKKLISIILTSNSADNIFPFLKRHLSDGENLWHLLAMLGKQIATLGGISQASLLEELRLTYRSEFIKVTTPNVYGNNALHVAVLSGNREFIDAVLSYHSDPSPLLLSRNSAGYTLLQLAFKKAREISSDLMIQQRSIEILESTMGRPDLPSAIDKRSEMFSSLISQQEIVSLLFQKIADLAHEAQANAASSSSSQAVAVGNNGCALDGSGAPFSLPSIPLERVMEGVCRWLSIDANEVDWGAFAVLAAASNMPPQTPYGQSEPARPASAAVASSSGSGDKRGEAEVGLFQDVEEVIEESGVIPQRSPGQAAEENPAAQVTISGAVLNQLNLGPNAVSKEFAR
jgi:ankyrin repeat protein